MQRYDIEETLMEKRDEGEFVKFGDHQAALDAVLKEAIWAMEKLLAAVPPHGLSDESFNHTLDFLASPAVRDYRARQE